MAQKQQPNDTKKILAVGALIFNLSIAGLGSLIAGRFQEGLLQLLLVGVSGLFVQLDFPGLFVGAAVVSAWLWALLTSIELLQAAYKR